MKKYRWVLAASAMFLFGGSVWAVSFTNDLTDAASVALDFNEYSSSHNNSAWSYTNDYALAQDGTANTVLQGGAVLDFVTADDDTARSYLGTIQSNWMEYSWTAHIGVETVNQDPKNYIFFGLGDPTPKASYYNEPQNGQSIFVYWRSGQSSSKVSVKLNGGTVTNTGAWQGDPGYDIYMTYNHTNKTVKFEVDNWNGGRYSDIDVDTGEISIDGSLTDTNKMHIFFGANAKVTFRDFDVVEAGGVIEEPESSAPSWFTVEAETRTGQSGTQLETCSDTGGGQNVSHISDGDWCLYEDIELGTNALLNFRVARPDGNDTAKIEVRLDSSTGILLGEVDVPETGGWQSWQTISTPIPDVAGTNDIYLVFAETGTTNGGSIFNLNWWSRKPLVEAEDYDAGAGWWFESTLDIGGGQNLGKIDAGEWMEYTINVETAGLHKIDFRVASNGGGTGIDILSGGANIGSLAVSDTGGWQVWETKSAYVNFTETGEQTLRLEFLSGGFNLNWFSYEPLSIEDTVSLTVGTARNQMMRLGLDYERLWYWSSSWKDDVAEWSVNDCNIDYIRTAVVAKYELTEATDPTTVTNYNLSAYTSKVIPMMTAMQEANPNIKWFASPRPLNESYPSKKWNGSDVVWQPHPIWITGAPDPITRSYNFQPIKCAQYFIRYLRLMKHYGFKISYLDLTNEWQDNDYGSKINQADARDLVEYMKAYIANPPDPASDPTDPTGFYAANYPALDADDMPLIVAASSWELSQGESWIKNLDTTRRRDAIDIASSHNTNRDSGSGTEEEFVAEVRNTLGTDTEIWQTEQHGWKGNSTSSEAMSFSFMIDTIRAGFTGINGWLAIGTKNQGHCYLLNANSTVTRNVKYYMFKKLSTTSNYGYALDIDETTDLSSTMALIRDNLLTIWVINTSSDAVLAEFDISGHAWDGSAITTTRWDEDLSLDGDETPEGIEGRVYEATASTVTAILNGRAAYCIEIPLIGNEDNFPFVQAEEYDFQTGVTVQPCSDTGGGDMVAFDAASDEISFDLDVTKTYSFALGFRVSSASANIAFDIYDGTNLLASIDEPATGGAQNWTTVYTGMNLDGGPMDLKIVATGGGWNMNWIEFEQGAVPLAPGGLYSTLGHMTVALDWDAVDDVYGYEVKRSTASRSGYISLGSTTGLTFTDSTVEAGQTYYYVVSAINKYGSSPDFDEVTGYGLPYEIIGPASSYAGSRPDLEKDNLFDKDVDTFYDTTVNNSWAGLDFGENNEQQITQVDYVLRDWTWSVKNGTNTTFEVANTADFSDAVTLFTITSGVQAYPAVNTETITDTTGYRYIRLKAPAGKPLYAFAELDVATIAATPNGTPVSWLESYGLTRVDDDLDSDGDGLLTWEEFLAGTAPNASGSVLEVNALHDSANGMVVTWQSVAGKSYSIITNGNLVAPNKGTAVSGIIGVDGETSHTTTVNSASALFFEIGVE